VNSHWIRGPLAILALLGALPAFGNTITVTNLIDSGAGSLRAAVESAASGDTITFSVSGTITLNSTLTIRTNLTINGPGSSKLAISGNNSVVVLIVGGGTTVAVSGLTITEGFNSAAGGWAGGLLNGGVLTLANCVVSSNSAGPSLNGGVGGGIFNYQGPLTVINSTISGNSAARGGGIMNDGNAVLTLIDTTVSGNTAAQDGGGVANVGGFVTITNTTVANNGASSGGGVSDISGTVKVTNSTITGNSANTGGGIAELASGTVTIKSTLLANAPWADCANSEGTFTSAGYNLTDDSTCASFLTQVGDANGGAVGLDPGGLKNNGGSTQTIRLLIASPAVDTVPVSACTDIDGNPVTTDQRGITRPQGTACDSGAFELVADDDSELARLSGSNIFTGNQTVNGTVTATSYSGDGSRLTNVTAATAATANNLNCAGCVGNSQLGVNYAGSGSQGGAAFNALAAANSAQLGGVPATNYARLDVGNAFSGNQTVTGNIAASGTVAVATSLIVGSGTAITEHISILVNPTLPALAPLKCAAAHFSLVGAADDDTIALGIPNGRMTGGPNVILNYSVWVSAANAVTLQACNLGGSAQKTTTFGAIRIDIWKH
jgi:hypothetical protein